MRDSKEYSWVYVTADTCVTDKKAELVYGISYPSAADNEVDLYNGQSKNGTLITKLFSAQKRSCPFDPPVGVYCDKGIFVDIGANVTGVFLMWRNL